MGIKEKKSILLVEDDHLIAMTEIRLLSKRGYNILHVNTGESAIETVFKRADEVDLILMDIDLGSGIDGTEAAKQILKDKDIPLVFLSSHTEPEVVEKTEGITSYGYIVKNTGETVLNASIKMAFKLYESKINEKEKELALIENEKRLNEAQRISHIGNWELNLITNRLSWSDEVFRIFEIDKEKFGASYEAFLNCIHPDDRETVNFAYTNSLKTHKP